MVFLDTLVKVRFYVRSLLVAREGPVKRRENLSSSKRQSFVKLVGTSSVCTAMDYPSFGRIGCRRSRCRGRRWARNVTAVVCYCRLEHSFQFFGVIGDITELEFNIWIANFEIEELFISP